MLRDLWHHGKPEDVTHFFKDWYKRVIHTNLEPLKKVTRTIKERLANVVSYCSLIITNAVAEGINSKIMAIKRRVGGYRNRQNSKTAIYFYCGGLNVYPQQSRMDQKLRRYCKATLRSWEQPALVARCDAQLRPKPNPKRTCRYKYQYSTTGIFKYAKKRKNSQCGN